MKPKTANFLVTNDKPSSPKNLFQFISSCELDLRLSKFKSLENPELSVVGGQKVLQYVEFFKE